MNAPVAIFSTSRKVRVLNMLNGWFRLSAIAPSYREISYDARVPVPCIREILDWLQEDGFLTHTPGKPRSIVLVDRCANISDDEFERGARGRGATIIWSKVEPLTEAFPLPLHEGVTDCEADLLRQIDDIAP